MYLPDETDIKEEKVKEGDSTGAGSTTESSKADKSDSA